MQGNEVNDQAPLNGNRGQVPPGSSAVEIAARKGFGPLSALANRVWHGDSKPCVSCGELVRRSEVACESCGEDLSSDKIDKMRAFAGPWYVLEHVRPFPGVACERLVRQIRRGVLTRMTVVRGPTTDHQWRFAGETPGLCKYLGVCWSCQARATIQHSRCSACGVDLGELTDETGGGEPARAVGGAVPVEAAELRRLRKAVKTAPRATPLVHDAPRVGPIRASWIVVAVVAVLVGILVTVVSLRNAGVQEQSRPHPATMTE